MKIHYLKCPDGTKLFSLNRHDYRTHLVGDKEYMIDGGFDYIRHSAHGDEEIVHAEIGDVIEDLRKVFTWGQNYDEHNNRLPKTIYASLKDLSTGHIYGILKYFTECLGTEVSKDWKRVHLFFIEELIYREKHT